jgi:phosphoglycerate dehydrogenase-like enzyme
MPLHVHILNLYSTAPVEELRAQLHPDIALTVGAEQAGDRVPPQTEILVSGFPRREHVAAAPGLRALIVPFAGVPAETCALLLDFPHVPIHALHYNVTPTAEMAVALLLAAAKLIVPLDADLRRFDWRRRYGVTAATTLQGKTAVILGYGLIGRHIAPALRGLGMSVIGVKRRAPEPGDGQEGVEVVGVADLHAVLPRADALIVVLPETPETTGLVGARELALLRPGALLVNVGRGPTVDEEVLYNALCDGTLRAAGIDVWYRYPQSHEARVGTPPSRFPFHELENVVLSPHRAGWISEAEHDRMAGLAEMLNAAAEGREMPGRIDKERGY